LVARRIHPVFCTSLERFCPEEAPTFIAVLPFSMMFLITMEVANAVVLMLELTNASPAIGEGRRVAANPVLAARGFHQWCMSIAGETTALPGDGSRFLPMVCHSILSGLRRWVLQDPLFSQAVVFLPDFEPIGMRRTRKSNWQDPG
jgi:hypothetical protein